MRRRAQVGVIRIGAIARAPENYGLARPSGVGGGNQRARRVVGHCGQTAAIVIESEGMAHQRNRKGGASLAAVGDGHCARAGRKVGRQHRADVVRNHVVQARMHRRAAHRDGDLRAVQGLRERFARVRKRSDRRTRRRHRGARDEDQRSGSDAVVRCAGQDEAVVILNLVDLRRGRPAQGHGCESLDLRPRGVVGDVLQGDRAAAGSRHHDRGVIASVGLHRNHFAVHQAAAGDRRRREI